MSVFVSWECAAHLKCFGKTLYNMLLNLNLCKHLNINVTCGQLFITQSLCRMRRVNWKRSMSRSLERYLIRIFCIHMHLFIFQNTLLYHICDSPTNDSSWNDDVLMYHLIQTQTAHMLIENSKTALGKAKFNEKLKISICTVMFRYSIISPRSR